MSLGPRAWGALLLTVLSAAPAMRAEAANPTPPRASERPTIQAFEAAAKKSIRRTRRARRRAPPDGVVWARHAVVVNPATGEVLFDKNSTTAVPIASLTKLMTALVFLEQNPDLARKAEVTRVEIHGGGHTRLRSRERVSLGDLLHMSLMCSDNVATQVMVREAGISSPDFLARMNRKAIELGLSRTRFVEFTGLDERNVSTAADCARLLRAATDQTLIQQIMTTRFHDFRSATRLHRIVNTNRLLVYRRYDIRGGKTGFISQAGYCFATWIHTESRDLIAVVLGAPTAATRFADVTRLVQRVSTPGVVQAH